MPPDTEQLDFKLAVTAWRTLLLEPSTNQKRFDLVWQPTQLLLNRLSANPQPVFTCFAGKSYMFPGKSYGVAVKLFFVGENNAVYLGTLLNRTATRIDRKREIQRLLLLNQDLAEKLRSASPNAIIRDSLMCKLQTESNTLNQRTATRAVKRWLSVMAPALLGCKIVWLPRKTGINLEKRIREQAEQTAQPSTKGERMRATAEDELDLW